MLFYMLSLGLYIFSCRRKFRGCILFSFWCFHFFYFNNHHVYKSECLHCFRTLLKKKTKTTQLHLRSKWNRTLQDKQIHTLRRIRDKAYLFLLLLGISSSGFNLIFHKIINTSFIHQTTTNGTLIHITHHLK